MIDYELIKDPESGKRLVAFGRFAGNAGMVDGLHGMAHRFLGLGYNMPFMVNECFMRDNRACLFIFNILIVSIYGSQLPKCGIG